MDIKKIRREIDEIDSAIIELMERRLDVSREIASYKRLSGEPIFDEAREREIYKTRARMVKNRDYRDYASSLMCNILTSSKKEQRRCMNVYLTGMPGAGKSEFARSIANKSSLTFMDTDKVVTELSGRSIEELFIEGEEVFRAYERDALTLCAKKGCGIVATGGGIVTDGRNITLMKQSGRVVLLNKAPDKLMALTLTGRPLIKSKEDIERLYHERIEKYLSSADFVLDPDDPNAVQDLWDYCVE